MRRKETRKEGRRDGVRNRVKAGRAWVGGELVGMEKLCQKGNIIQSNTLFCKNNKIS